MVGLVDLGFQTLSDFARLLSKQILTGEGVYNLGGGFSLGFSPVAGSVSPGAGCFSPDEEFLTREGIDGSFWEFIAALRDRLS